MTTPLAEALQRVGVQDYADFQKQQKGFDVYVVWILSSRGGYRDFCRDRYNVLEQDTISRTHYCFSEREAVTYLESEHGWSFDDMQPLAHEMVHFFQDAYAPPVGIKGISSYRIVEGMAEWISTFSGDIPEGPYSFMQRNDQREKEFLELIDQRDGRWPIPLELILTVSDGRSFEILAEDLFEEDEELAALGSRDDVVHRLTCWFYAATYSICRYCYADNEKPFIDYIKAEFSGDGDVEVLQSLLGYTDLEELEESIESFVRR